MASVPAWPEQRRVLVDDHVHGLLAAQALLREGAVQQGLDGQRGDDDAVDGLLPRLGRARFHAGGEDRQHQQHGHVARLGGGLDAVAAGGWR